MTSKITCRRDEVRDCWVAEAQVGSLTLVTATGQCSAVTERDALHAVASALAERLAKVQAILSQTEQITLPVAR